MINIRLPHSFTALSRSIIQNSRLEVDILYPGIKTEKVKKYLKSSKTILDYCSRMKNTKN